MSSEMEEFKQIFFTEAGELLAEMEERLLKLDEGSQDMDQLNAIFRCAHSIKARTKPKPPYTPRVPPLLGIIYYWYVGEIPHYYSYQ